MYAIRQFVESLGIGLGVGLFLVVGALLFLESTDGVDPGNEPGAVSAPITQPDLRRDESGVPIRPDAQPGRQSTRAGDEERVG